MRRAGLGYGQSTRKACATMLIFNTSRSGRSGSGLKSWSVENGPFTDSDRLSTRLGASARSLRRYLKRDEATVGGRPGIVRNLPRRQRLMGRSRDHGDQASRF